MNTQGSATRDVNTTTLARRSGRWSALLIRQEATLVLVIVAIGMAAWIRNGAFLTPSNIAEILNGAVIYFVMGCGAALLVVGGGLDFSVGAVFTFGALTASSFMVDGMPFALAVLLGVLGGALVGLVNHAVIAFLHVPPIIATLGTFFVLVGTNAQITGGMDVLPLPLEFQTLGQGKVLGVPYIVLDAAVIGAIFWVLLEWTRFGINIRALGGNRQAAVGNGLRVGRLDLWLYVIAGATAAFAGIVHAARIGAGQVSAGGPSVTLSVITAVLIGGVSLLGGLGSITGVALGAVLLSLVQNALVVSRIPPQYNQIVIGAILIGAVAIDHLRRERLYRQRR
ncbi:ribose transport system permease protein [Marmoricola sp. URHA0025 HA25]